VIEIRNDDDDDDNDGEAKNGKDGERIVEID